MRIDIIALRGQADERYYVNDDIDLDDISDIDYGHGSVLLGIIVHHARGYASLPISTTQTPATVCESIHCNCLSK